MPKKALETSSHVLELYPAMKGDSAYYVLTNKRWPERAFAQPLTLLPINAVSTPDESSMQLSLGGQVIGTVRKCEKDTSLDEFISEWNLNLSLLSDLSIQKVVSTDADEFRDDYLIKRKHLLVSELKIKIRIITWNLAGKNLDKDLDLSELLDTPDLLIVCIQESDTLGRNLYANKHTLDFNSTKILESLPQKYGYKIVESNQLLGLMMIAIATSKVADQITSLNKATTGTGLFGRIGNKGACGISLTIGSDAIIPFTGTQLSFINCHLSAGEHVDILNRRRWELSEIGNKFCYLLQRNEEVFDSDAAEIREDFMQAEDEESEPRDIRKIWFLAGDLNYRLHMNKEIAHEFASKKDYATLLIQDTLKSQMKEGRVLDGFREGEIEFPPTYKYNGDVLDTERVPSYCDRILHRADDHGVRQHSYESIVEFIVSDHKPVYADYSVTVSQINQGLRQKLIDESLREYDILERSSHASMKVSPLEIKGPEDGEVLTEQEACFCIENDSASPCAGKWEIISDEPGLTFFPKISGVTPIGATQKICVRTTLPTTDRERTFIVVVRLVDIKDIFITLTFTASNESQLGRPINKKMVNAVIKCLQYLEQNDCTGTFANLRYLETFNFNRTPDDVLPGLCKEVQTWIDKDIEFDHQVLNEANKAEKGLGTVSVVQELFLLLHHAKDRLIPAEIYIECVHVSPIDGQAVLWKHLENEKLESHRKALQYLVRFMRELVIERRQAAMDEIVAVFEPVLFEVPSKFTDRVSLYALWDEKKLRKRLLTELLLRSVSDI